MTTSSLSARSIILKTVVVHSVTYFIVGLLAFTLFDYSARFADPSVSAFLRQTDSLWVAAGPLFQPLRGLLFGIVFFLLRDSLFTHARGWLTGWIMLVFVGIFSTFGPAPGSVEGFIYTKIPPFAQLGGLIEVLLQSFLLSFFTFIWVTQPQRRWLGWIFIGLFIIGLILPVLGLIFAGQV